MPFITEEFIKNLTSKKTIMIEEWQYDESLGYEDDVLKLEEVKRVVKSIRNLRAEMNIHPSKKSKLFIKTNREY